jgi:ABC-type Mn2+/Zn2+ transport system permease subunit
MPIIFLLLVGVFVSVAASYLGSFMVLKRMSLVGDAMSHVALPGIAIAIALGFEPILGAFIALTIAVFVIWYLQETSEVYPEALVGVLFTASLALGVILTEEPDLLEALFGNIDKIGLIDGVLSIFLSIAVIFIVSRIRNCLIVGVLSEELAKSAKFSTKRTNLIYLLLVGTVVALGVKFVGTLLMGALVIVPPASAKNVSGGLTSYYAMSMLFAGISAVAGILLASILSLSAGPLVVLASIFIFLITYLVKKLALD